MKDGATYYEVCGIAYAVLSGEAKRFYYHYALLKNAEEMAEKISECADVFHDVDVVDMTTGEVVLTYIDGEMTYISRTAQKILYPALDN